MFGQATLEIPRSGNIGPSRTDGLSDEMAMLLGRAAARTLLEQDGLVVVTLSDGTLKTIGYDTLMDKMIIGRLTFHYS